MRRINVEFETLVPDGVSDEQITEWIRFELHEICSTDSKNPCMESDLDAISGTVDIKEGHRLLPLKP